MATPRCIDDKNGSPLCGAADDGAYLVEEAIHSTCPCCLLVFALHLRTALEAAFQALATGASVVCRCAVVALLGLWLTACGAPAEQTADAPDLGPVAQDGAPSADLAQTAVDGSQPQVDQGHAPADLSGPPADLSPACGGEGQPCCGAEACINNHLPNGSYCPGACDQGEGSIPYHACWMVAGVPTCEPCGGVGFFCCTAGQIPPSNSSSGGQCLGSDTCAGSSSANANHC